MRPAYWRLGQLGVKVQSAFEFIFIHRRLMQHFKVLRVIKELRSLWLLITAGDIIVINVGNHKTIFFVV